VSCFCAEIQLSGKILENIAKILFYQKTHGARRRDEGRLWPDGWRVVNYYYGQAVGKHQVESMMSTAASLFPQ
jgi:hypothetical protein